MDTFNDDPLLEAEADKIGLQAANHPMAAQAEMPTTVIPGQSGTSVASGLTTASSSGRIVQRKVKIGVNPAKTYANLQAFRKSELYKQLVPVLSSMYDPNRVAFHLGQLFSGDWDFVNEEHFVEALRYDIETKSLKGEEHTLQEQYMTLYGWKKRAGADAQPANAGGAGAEPGAVEQRQRPQLRVYRTMPWDRWEELQKGNYEVLERGHLGDFKQAQDYLYRDKSSGSKALVEFTLYPGAEQTLFSSTAMAFPNKQGGVPGLIKSILTKEGDRGEFGVANVHEGTAPDRVGMKAEGGEAGFSLGIGGGTSPQLFKSMVEKVRVVGSRNEPSPGGSGAPSQEPEESGAS